MRGIDNIRDSRIFYSLKFVEYPPFTNKFFKVATDEEYQSLQDTLRVNPETGVLVPQTGGVRKIRIALRGMGKRGGGRVIYYYRTSHDEILFFDIYVKNEKSDLTSQEKAMFATLIQKMKKEDAE